MKQQQRRVFLKVIAVSPLIGCGGVDPSAPHGFGGASGNAAGGTSGSGSNPSLSGGGNSAPGGGGHSSFSGGSSTGGGPAASGGSPATTGGATAGGASPGGTSSAGGSSNDPATAIGNVSSFPLGTFTIAGSIYFLAHDAGGLYAMSMQCTHAGCAVVMKGNELDCPCHASRFDHLGNVLAGPAKTPLPHYPVFVDATGNITVDRFTIVSMSTRTPV